jgi:thiamine biosynthesis lipoprotein
MPAHVVQCMGTVFSIDLRGTPVPDGTLRDAETLLHRLDRTFSTYQPDSTISLLARGELDRAEADPEVDGALQACEQWRRRTNGWFDVQAAGTLDPSGYVKGWAIRRVSELLTEAGSTSHCINGGGDVQCLGWPAIGRNWRAGIADPRDRRRLVATVGGPSLAVATSGSAERGEHVYDPHTRRPATGELLSVSVVGQDVIECDILATAAFAMGERCRDWLAAWPGVGAFAVCADGSTWQTSSLFSSS